MTSLLGNLAGRPVSGRQLETRAITAATSCTAADVESIPAISTVEGNPLMAFGRLALGGFTTEPWQIVLRGLREGRTALRIRSY
jgi:hypothetical protein